jgi:hypothetical protein
MTPSTTTEFGGYCFSFLFFLKLRFQLAPKFAPTEGKGGKSQPSESSCAIGISNLGSVDPRSHLRLEIGWVSSLPGCADDQTTNAANRQTFFL